MADDALDRSLRCVSAQVDLAMETSIEGDAPIAELQRTSSRNVFVMMRYRSGRHFAAIESCVRASFAKYGLIARFAKDRILVDDLWENIVLYMRHCRFGLVVFEEIDEREYNPNVSLELGYMYSLGRRCLLLKEQRMPRLPTDICGRIYRNFDMLNIQESIGREIDGWCRNDLGLPLDSPDDDHPEAQSFKIVYDNGAEDPEFRSWGRYASDGPFEQHVSLVPGRKSLSGPGSEYIAAISAIGSESVGINKAFYPLRGRVVFEYQARSSEASNPNLLFCMIPMKGTPRQLLEVGARRRDESANAYSPYRVRFFVPDDHIGDEKWHSRHIDFDFNDSPEASYSIFAPRVNEGCPRPGSGELDVGNVQVLVPIGDDVNGEIRAGDYTPSSSYSR